MCAGPPRIQPNRHPRGIRRRAEDDQDKALWLTLAQSWIRLAEHVERSAGGRNLELEAERAS